MKRIILTGRIVDGRVVVTRPTLDEQIAINEAQIARNRATLAEIDAMHADLDALQREPNSFTCTGNLDELLDALDENPGEDYCTRPWQW